MRGLPTVLLLAACGGAPASGEDVPVDSTLVDVLVEVHLADARAALVTDSARTEGLADSLRAIALDAHGLEEAGYRQRLGALGDDPALARATYSAVETRLADDRQGLSY